MRRPRQSRQLHPPPGPAARQVAPRPEVAAGLITGAGTGRSLLAGSLLLMLTPSAYGLTLGEISVRSALGQPLNATVPVRIGAGEALAGACVAPVEQRSDLRRVPGARVTTPEASRPGEYELRVTSTSALYEPMYELELKVKCPGSASVVRQYVLMLDLPGAIASEPASPRALNVPAPVPATAPVRGTADSSPAARPRATAARPGTKIDSGSVYLVSDGDTLSGIAARVQDRNVSLRVLASAIQAANPDAFIRNDANLIKLGSRIRIPDAAAASSLAAARPVPPAASPPEPSVPAAIAPAVPTSPPEVAAAQATPVATATAATLPAPDTPLEPEQPRVIETPVTEAPVAVARRAAAPAAAPADDTNPVVAVGAGVLFGLAVSALLWFRVRLPSPKQSVARPSVRKDTAEPKSPAMPAAAPLAPVVKPLVTRTVEPGFSVSYSDDYDDSLAAGFSAESEPTAVSKAVKSPLPAAPVPGDEITSELEKLFDGTDTTIRKRLDAEAAAAGSPGDGEETQGFHPSDVDPENAVDFFIGDLPEDEDDGTAAQTTDLARPTTASTSDSGKVDIHSLASAASKDEQQAQTLLEALTLLERDYEEELTASQVLDMSAVRKMMTEADEPKQDRDELPRKKAR
jgi:FimV-like protein